MYSRAPVGRRLFLLVAVQTAIAFLLVLLAMRAIFGLTAAYERMYHFQLQAVAAIGQAISEASRLQPGSHSHKLEDFYRRYRSDWEVASGTSRDAIQFRKEMAEDNATNLLQFESSVLANLDRSLNAGDPEEIRKDLAALYDLNIRYAALDDHFVKERIRSGSIWIFSTGLVSIAVILFLGLYVRRAIAPRIKSLVTHVQKFQATGNFERIGDLGKDDIAVLANALDAGLSAIALRDDEREEFLSIAAHELKTPVTSIHGYASLLVHNPPAQVNVERALKGITRQSWRLSRLIDRLFLGMRALHGELHFEPKPFNMSALVEQVLDEMAPLIGNNAFLKHIVPDISILGDEALLEHALWALLACASSFMLEHSTIDVSFCRIGHGVRLAIAINKANAAIPELQELFLPFHFVQYETRDGVRSAIGLYLCREIVRVHNGSLRVEEHEPKRPEFVMELPI
jgi:signal transduction histidine kinase